MQDLRDILPHLAHANLVKGGALLVQELTPYLAIEQFRDDRLRRRAPLSPALRTRRIGKRTRRTADSAEGIRALKIAHGVPLRPVTVPVDVWARRARP